MSKLFRFSEQGVVRIPLFPIIADFTPARLFESLKCEKFLLSIYLASPSFYSRLIPILSQNESLDDKKVILTLFKYLSRASYRCTPFGLFASCTPVNVLYGDTRERKNLVVSETISKKIKFDFHFLIDFKNELQSSENFNDQLRYFKNVSVYNFLTKVRYFDALDSKKGIHYQLASVSKSDHLDRILEESENGLSKDQLVQVLSKMDIDGEDALEFINQLIDANLLISELEPHFQIPYTEQLLKVLISLTNKKMTGDDHLQNLKKQPKNLFSLKKTILIT